MDELAKQPKISVELKQTAKGFWYVGSLKVNGESIEEMDALLVQGAAKVSQRVSTLNVPTIVPFAQAPKQEKISKPAIILNPEEEKIFRNLKELRLILSQKEGVPPYVIFHDSTLQRVAKEKPFGKEHLLLITGEKKLAKYGDLILELLEQYRSIVST